MTGVLAEAWHDGRAGGRRWGMKGGAEGRISKSSLRFTKESKGEQVLMVRDLNSFFSKTGMMGI